MRWAAHPCKRVISMSGRRWYLPTRPVPSGACHSRSGGTSGAYRLGCGTWFLWYSALMKANPKVTKARLRRHPVAAGPRGLITIIMTVRAHDDFLVRPHWETMLPAPWPDIPVIHVILTLSAWLGTTKYKLLSPWFDLTMVRTICQHGSMAYCLVYRLCSFIACKRKCRNVCVWMPLCIEIGVNDFVSVGVCRDACRSVYGIVCRCRYVHGELCGCV